jgi:DNA modification methylase
MEKDYGTFKKNKNIQCALSVPLVGDARDLDNVINPDGKEKLILPKGEIDSIITSPPYCNSADYIEMYKLEHWFLRYITSYAGFREMSEATVRSHTTFEDRRTLWTHPVVEDICAILEKKKLWNKKIPAMIKGYFDDMHKALGQMRLFLRRQGNVILLVANSSYAETPIPTDLLLAEAARDQGFEVRCIMKVRRLTTSGQQWTSMDPVSKRFLRESVLTLKSD